jgi:hypothetical protein
MLHTTRDGVARPTPFLLDVQELCRRAKFDRATSEWHIFAWTAEESEESIRSRTRLPPLDKDRAVGDVVRLLQNLFLGKAWPIAALSRWSNVVKGLKLLVFGVAFGHVLTSALSLLGSSMKLDEGEVTNRLLAMAAAVAQGGQEQDHWAKHCARVFRVAKFWAVRDHSWQSGIALLVCATTDKLTTQIFGKDHSMASLSDMVDPKTSIVAHTCARLHSLLLRWGSDTRWALLQYLTHLAWKDQQDIKRFARRQVIVMQCGLYKRMLSRCREFPYRLQWLISDHVSDETKTATADAFFRTPPHCLSPRCRRLQSHFVDSPTLLGPAGLLAVRALDRVIIFSTHPVEVDHKQCKDDMSSSHKGLAHSHIAHRSVVRHYRAAFQEKGNPNPVAKQPCRQVLRSSIAQPAIAAASVAGSLPASASTAIVPYDPATAAMSLADRALVLSLNSQVKVQSLGGGNPKIMYMNHRLHTEKLCKGDKHPFSKEELIAFRTTALATYDQNMALQQSWKGIFDVVSRHNKLICQLNVRPIAACRKPIVHLWPAARADQIDTPLPLPTNFVQQHFDDKFKTMRQLDASSRADSAFLVDQNTVKDRVSEADVTLGSL